MAMNNRFTERISLKNAISSFMVYIVGLGIWIINTWLTYSLSLFVTPSDHSA